MDTSLLVRLIGARRSSVSALAPVTALQFDLARFRAGEELRGHVVGRLADGAYKLSIEGKAVRVALPTEHQPGDEVRLAVQSTREGLRLAPQPNTLADVPRVSGGGQLLASLLREAESVATPLRPAVLGAPSDDAAEIATPLARAVEKSGAFYESHLARWIDGDYPLEALRDEPQAARLVVPNSTPDPRPQPASQSVPWQGAISTLHTDDADSDKLRTAPDAPTQGMNRSEPVARESLPHVRQQLDLLDSRPFVWSGELWPGQTMRWEIEDNRERSEEQQDGYTWATTIGLTLATIGPVHAELKLTKHGLRVSLSADDRTTVEAMKSALPELHQKLSEAGLVNPNIVVRERGHFR